MSTRVRSTTTGLIAKRIATEIHLFEDPIAGTQQLVFQGEEFLLAPDGSPSEKLEGRQAVVESVSDLAGQTFDAGKDPVTGEDLNRISTEGVLRILHAMYAARHTALFAPAP